MLFLNILDKIIEYIRKFGQDDVIFLKSIEQFQKSDYRYASSIFEIKTRIVEKDFILIVALPHHFPASLPEFYDKEGQLGFIPHVEKDGCICYTRNENIVIDERFPGAIVLECLKKVKSLIEDGLLGRNQHDFIEEFEVYWMRAGTSFSAICLLDDSNKVVRETDLFKVPTESGYYIFVSERKINPSTFLTSLLHREVQIVKQRCIFIPLEQGSFIQPPGPDEIWTIDEFRTNVLTNLSLNNRNRLLRLLRRTPKSNLGDDFFIVSLPIDRKRNALFGVNLLSPEQLKNHPQKYKHPFISSHPEFELSAFNIIRHNKNHLLKRTGGDIQLTRKHAVIVGLGAIGSPIAIGLAKSGFDKLTLIDYDFLEADNIYRHELGVNQLFKREGTVLKKQYKVDAVGDEISKKYPFTQTNPIVGDIRNVLEEIDWNAVDIVLVCIGSPNTEMVINQFMQSLDSSPPTLYTWLEPLGIGGHVLVTNNRIKTGCYKCLFRPVSEYQPISNLASFSEPRQSFSVSLTGCGSYFTPYNFLDSEQTANLALRTVFNVLNGSLEGNPILSWKGDATLFLEQGYKLSSRYNMSDEVILGKQREYIDPNCPVCGNGGVNG